MTGCDFANAGSLRREYLAKRKSQAAKTRGGAG